MIKLTKEEIIRICLIIFGISFIILGLYNLYSLFLEFTSKFFEINIDFLKNYGEFITHIFINKFEVIIYLIIGVILFYLGFEWKKIFLSISRTLISISIFFLFIGVFLFVIHSNSDEISNSIQPSLDYLIVDIANKNLKDSNLIQTDKKTIDFSIYKNPKIYDIQVKNLTLEQANYLIKNLNIENSFTDANSKILFSKILITQISKNYSNLIKEKLPINIKIPIPIELIKENSKDLNSLDFNLDFIGYLTESEIVDLGFIDRGSEIQILDSDGIEKIKFNIQNPEGKEINSFLDALEINNHISMESKKFYSQILVINLLKIINSYGIDDNLVSQIPLNIVGFLIPKEYKSLFNYDLFSNNSKNNAKELYRFRENCETGILEVKEFCEYVNVTKYDNLIKFLEGNSSINLSIQNLNFNNINNSEIKQMPKEFKTISGIKNLIEEKSEKYLNYFLIFILLIILGIISYIIHYKYIIEEEINLFDLSYFISKKLFISYFLSFIPFILFYYFIKSDYFFNFLKNQISLISQENGVEIFNLITNLSSFNILFDIIDNVFNIYFYIFAFLFLLFMTLLAYKLLYKKSNNNLNNNFN